MQNLLERTDMRMVRLMMGLKTIEKIRNEEIRARAGVANISEKFRVTRLIWLVDVERKTKNIFFLFLFKTYLYRVAHSE